MFLSELPGKLKRWVLVVKSPPANAGDIEDVGSIPGLRRQMFFLRTWLRW